MTERYGRCDLMSEKITSPLKAIKAKCMDCCCFQYAEVKNCEAFNCPLYDFRLGKNPHIKRNLTEQQRIEAGERLKKLRERNNY